MKPLGREARELLNAAANANGAPRAVRARGRNRLLGALAMGSISTTAVMAEGAWAGAQVTVVGAGAASATPLLATLVSSVMIGLSTGLVAISPASQTQTTRVAFRQVPTNPRTAPKTHPVAAFAPLESAAATTAVPTRAPTCPTEVEAPKATAEQVERAPLASPIPPPPQDLPSGSEVQRGAEFVEPEAVPSIARETELLAHVQRALKGGRAGAAVHWLDQYQEEFPSGALHEEATASRVVALCTLERFEEAHRWTDTFTRNYPGSPLIGRVRGACPKAATRSSR